MMVEALLQTLQPPLYAHHLGSAAIPASASYTAVGQCYPYMNALAICIKFPAFPIQPLSLRPLYPELP